MAVHRRSDDRVLTLDSVTPSVSSSIPHAPVRIELDGGSEGAASAAQPQMLGPSRAPGSAPPASTAPGPVAVRRVAVVIPCFNRPRDLELVLADLARVPTGDGAEGGKEDGQVGGNEKAIDLRAIVVDNASDPPLETVRRPEGVDVRILRLETNTGGAGGFNAGMAYALGEMERDGEPWEPEFLWLVDSDARVLPDTLAKLMEALDADPTVIAAGSAIAAPPYPTGPVFEIGGRVHRGNGRFGPVVRGAVGISEPVECDYVAACSALVRADAVRRGGLMPDVFLNGDDVEWFIRLGQRAREVASEDGGKRGGRIVGVPGSVAFHPMFDRFATLPRYYIARNGFGPIDALGLGRWVRLRRALREVARAVGQAMMGRDDLARLHIMGLRDAARGGEHALGPAPAGMLKFDSFRPLTQLGEALKQETARLGGDPTVLVHHELGIPEADQAEIERQLEAAGVRRRSGKMLRFRPGSMLPRLIRPVADIAVVPARGRPHTWMAGRVMVQVIPGGFVLRPGGGVRTLARTAAVAAEGCWHAARLWARRRRPTPMRAAPTRRMRWPRENPTVSVIVLSHNRWPALRATLEHLMHRCGLPASAIVVVDNASTDGTPAHVAELYPEVRLHRLESNAGVEAFNVGARGADGELLLILDDDARPDPEALAAAAALLGRRPDLAAVTLHPRHPATGASEWPFAAAAGQGDDRWPVMGCANLVRRADWEQVGGYDGGFFLYRNDTDLALRLLAAGRGVHFNPEWTVWHDSPAASRKSVRWHRLATRNWLWIARRHGRGASGVLAGVAGWAWAHRLAGVSVGRQWATIRGAAEGLLRRPPAVWESTGEESGIGSGLKRLVELQFSARSRGAGIP